MDTEPPTGDELTRMIVSMKQGVLQRTADEKPRRNRLRAGLIIGLVVLLGLGTASGAVALGLVPQPFAAPAPSEPTPSHPVSTPKASPAPSSPPSPTTPQPTAAIPTSCTSAVDTADYTRLFGSTPLQQLRPVSGGATAEPIPRPTGAGADFLGDATLYCAWHDPQADITSLTVGVGTASEPTTSTYQSELTSQGFTCTEADGGRSCQQVKKDPEYGVDIAKTFFVRDGTWIEITQANFPTNNLLGALTHTIWGS